MGCGPAATLIVILLAGALSASGAESAGTWDPRTFGAKGDGRTLDTAAIQRAIDACADAGGGTVSLHGGVFLSGTIRLRNHVTLWIASGATLRGSERIEDYWSITPQIPFLYRDRFTKSLIYAERQEDIALAGGGVIDGQGQLFPARPGDDGGRPYLLRFSECRNVQVRGLTLRDSARWLSHYLACEDVTIEGVTIHSRIRENRDGTLRGEHDVCTFLSSFPALIGMLRIVTRSVSEEDRRFLADASDYCDPLPAFCETVQSRPVLRRDFAT